MNTDHTKKLTLGILCGGRSGEHEVSLRSAAGIFAAIDTDRFDPLLVAIDKDGGWRCGHAHALLIDADDPAAIRLNPESPVVTPAPRNDHCALLRPDTGAVVAEIDAFFPIIHGTDGEDGALQGLLRMMNVPFAGADVLGSAVGMDKDIMKRLLSHAELPVSGFQTFYSREDALGAFSVLSKTLGLPLFVKPAALGSSVGISRVSEAGQWEAALSEAFAYDNKVIIEEAVPGRELECAVLGNRHSSQYPPQASIVGEIIPHLDFYSYAAKYLDDKGAELVIPAPLDEVTHTRLRELAVKVFNTLECDGLARVDFFLREDGNIYVNEINTLPGFTPISMYPKLWEATGMPYTQLLTRLVELGVERHRGRAGLKRNFDLS